MASPRVGLMAGPIAALVRRCREAGIQVVAFADTHAPDVSRRAIWIPLSKWPMLQTMAWSRIRSMCSSVMMSQLPVQVT